MRAAIIRGENISAVQAYLPHNYKVLGAHSGFTVKRADDGSEETIESGVLIVGEDDSGWTLDGYVLPRLASGLHYGFEIELPL